MLAADWHGGAMWRGIYNNRVNRIKAHKVIWHFCTPKCASTFLMKHMQAATAHNERLAHIPCIPLARNRPQVVCAYTVSLALDDAPRANVMQGMRTHALATEDLANVISENHLVVLQTRSIADTVVSMLDHLNKSPYTFFWAPMETVWPDLSDDEKIDHLISTYVPWHIQFVQGWERAAAGKNVLWLTYDDAISDPNKICEKVYAFHSVDYRPTETRKEDSGQFNVGRSGRGKEKLSQAQRDKMSAVIATFERRWEKRSRVPAAALIP